MTQWASASGPRYGDEYTPKPQLRELTDCLNSLIQMRAQCSLVDPELDEIIEMVEHKILVLLGKDFGAATRKARG